MSTINCTKKVKGKIKEKRRLDQAINKVEEKG